MRKMRAHFHPSATVKSTTSQTQNNTIFLRQMKIGRNVNVGSISKRMKSVPRQVFALISYKSLNFALKTCTFQACYSTLWD